MKMNEIFVVFLSLSISGTIIALVLFLLKPLIKDRFSKTWQYYIWLVVVVRLLLPLSSEMGIVGELFSQAGSYIAPQEQSVSLGDLIPGDAENTNLQLPSSLANEVAEKNTDYVQALKDNIWLFWLVIAFMLFVRKVTSYHSFVGYVKAGRKKVTDNEVLSLYQKVSEFVGMKKPLPLYKNELMSSPMLVGVVRPFIVLPDLSVNTEEICHILQHELTHYKRRDIFYKWLIQIAVCLHWFNPIVYVISREINKNCELACDEAVIKRMDEKTKIRYGDTLLATIKPDGGYSNAVISVTLNEDARLLKERLGAIMKFNKKSTLIGILTLILTVGVFCGATFIGAYAGQESTNDSVNATPKYSLYEPYGLTYDTEKDKLFYDGQTVRYFVDEFSNGHGYNAYYDYDLDGTIDLYAVRENDGENGILTGIAAYSQEDFDLRTLQIESEQNTESDYSEAYKMTIEEAPESLLLWVSQCETSVHDGIFVAEQNGRYYVYCRTTGGYDFEITPRGNNAKLTIYDTSDSGTGYALISVPYYEGLSIEHNDDTQNIVR